MKKIIGLHWKNSWKSHESISDVTFHKITWIVIHGNISHVTFSIMRLRPPFFQNIRDAMAPKKKLKTYQRYAASLRFWIPTEGRDIQKFSDLSEFLQNGTFTIASLPLSTMEHLTFYSPSHPSFILSLHWLAFIQCFVFQHQQNFFMNKLSIDFTQAASLLVVFTVNTNKLANISVAPEMDKYNVR